MLEYDDSAFYYFSLTLISFYLAPVSVATLFQIFGAVVPNYSFRATVRTSDEKKKIDKLKKEQKSLAALIRPLAFKIKLISLIIGWILLYTLLSTMKKDTVGLARFDPYAILGIEVGADDKEIKRSYRNLAKEYHPDKNPNNKMAEDMFMKIAKAYAALTDPQSRKNWEDYGNPDGKQPMAVSIALPTFLLDKQHHNSVLIVYLLAMVIIIPSIVAMWYAKSKKYGENNVMYDTYTWYNHMLSDDPHIQKIPEVLAGSAEFRISNKMQKKFEKDIKKLYQEFTLATKENPVPLPKLRYDHPILLKGTVLLLAHMKNKVMHPELERDMYAMLKKSPELIEAMVELVVSRRWLQTTLAVIEFSQMLIQGLWVGESHLMQFPYIGHKEAATMQSMKQMPKSLKEFIENESLAARALSSNNENDSISNPSVIQSVISDEKKRKEIWAAIDAFPNVSMSVSCFVDDEEEIAEGDLVTLKVTITRDNVPDGAPIPPVYAPRYPLKKDEGWWILLANTKSKQVISYCHVVASKKICEKELKLMAPSKPSSVYLDLYVKSDCYIGLDRKLDVKFNVVSSSTLPVYVPHPDDLELDNEPTLFEQVMQGYDDSDSDDEATEKKSNPAANATLTKANDKTEQVVEKSSDQ